MACSPPAQALLERQQTARTCSATTVAMRVAVVRVSGPDSVTHIAVSVRLADAIM
jgi:hypothetical protein